MIELIQTGRKSFHLRMNTSGIKRMMRYLEIIRDIPSIVISNNGKNKNFFIEIAEMDEAENLIITNQEVKLELDEEEIADFYLSLEEALEKGMFFPAEFCERRFKKWTGVDIYVFLCKEDE